MPLEPKECPFCGETIKAQAIKCRFCGEFLDKHTHTPSLGDAFGQDRIDTGIGDNAADVAVGKNIQQAHTGEVKGFFIQAQGDITFGKSQRDEYYQIALNWENHGKPRLRKFDLARQDLSELTLVEADLKGANLTNADLSRTNLSRANLQDAKLPGANLSGASLVSAKLVGADLSGANLTNVNLDRANLQQANLSYAALFNAYLKGADLYMAILNGTKIDDTTQLDEKWRFVWQVINQKIENPLLKGVILTQVNRFGDTITGNNLASVDFYGTNLSYVDLSGDDLSGANLNKAILREANLRYANLSMACLESADLCGTNLTYADLSEANLSRVMYNSKTIWPVGFTPPPEAVEIKTEDEATSAETQMMVEDTQLNNKDIPF